MDFFIFASEQWVLLSILLMLIYAFVWRESSKGGKSLTCHQLTRMMNAEEAVLIDVRESKEFSTGHITGAKNYPFNKIQSRISELEAFRDKTLVIVDKMGQHAGSIGRDLTKQGYSVMRLGGGMTEWSAEKLPLIKD